MPLNALMDDNYLKQRMANSFDKATSSSDIKEGNVTYNESMETTHYSIVDQFEMPLPQQRLLMRVMVQVLL
jgi:gamma-glutamyltranspeptidase/glutathione hydrolase